VRGVGPGSEGVVELQRHLKQGDVRELGKLHDVPVDDASRDGGVARIIVGKTWRATGVDHRRSRQRHLAGCHPDGGRDVRG